jgi:transketolase
VRKVFQEVVSEKMLANENLYLLLGDIGVFGFRTIAEQIPSRVKNMGIMEQAMVSFASGIAKMGGIPILHSIAPFLIERPLEQIKVDFGYQGLPGKFVSVGGSFDYSHLGGTHHAAGDVASFGAIPDSEIWIPAGNKDLKEMLRKEIETPKLSYFRLSERPSEYAIDPGPVGISTITRGSRLTVVAIGPMLTEALEATKGLDVTLLSINRIKPLPIEEIIKASSGSAEKIIFLEPYYEGLTAIFIEDLAWSHKVRYIGVRKSFLHDYGNFEHLQTMAGLDPTSIRQRIELAMNN